MFEWDEEKRQINLDKHGIDFIDAKDIWAGSVLEIASLQDHDEERMISVGEIGGVIITVIYTWRGENRRLISARKARKNEQEDYKNGIG